MHTSNNLTAFLVQLPKDCTVGFVPTMGALHEGHGALIRQAAAENDVVIVSIFVNPKQFGPSEDFNRYPRTPETDMTLATEYGASFVWLPKEKDIYPKGFSTQVLVQGPLVQGLCAPFRPGHFEGVATVVTRLLNLVKPHRLYLGQKDIQQVLVIQRVIQDLALSVKLVSVPTIRDTDGLAMSSRNRYLSPTARNKALNIPRALKNLENEFASGERRVNILKNSLLNILKQEQLEPQYLEFCQYPDLLPLNEEENISQKTVVAIAQFIVSEDGSSTRLIDNIILNPNS